MNFPFEIHLSIVFVSESQSTGKVFALLERSDPWSSTELGMLRGYSHLGGFFQLYIYYIINIYIILHTPLVPLNPVAPLKLRFSQHMAEKISRNRKHGHSLAVPWMCLLMDTWWAHSTGFCGDPLWPGTRTGQAFGLRGCVRRFFSRFGIQPSETHNPFLIFWSVLPVAWVTCVRRGLLFNQRMCLLPLFDSYFTSWGPLDLPRQSPGAWTFAASPAHLRQWSRCLMAGKVATNELLRSTEINIK